MRRISLGQLATSRLSSIPALVGRRLLASEGAVSTSAPARRPERAYAGRSRTRSHPREAELLPGTPRAGMSAIIWRVETSSRQVTAAIRRHVWSHARNHGFEDSGRNVWRRHDDRIEVIAFWSLGSYNAEVMRTTSFSFKIGLGVWLDYASSLGIERPARDDSTFRPKEEECPIRRSLRSRATTVARDQAIWHVNPDGSNLEFATVLAWEAIEQEGLPWFARFASPLEVLRTICEDAEDMAGTWGLGNLGSPAREHLKTQVEAYAR